MDELLKEVCEQRDLMFNSSTDWEDRFFESITTKYGEDGTKIAQWSIV